MANITVSVAYALPEQQVVLELELEQGATIEKAVLESGILQKFPEIDLTQNKVGIYGHVAVSYTHLTLPTNREV